jgi:hypothetical protein
MNETQKAPPVDLRLPALRRFGAAITILTLFGQIVLGFEPGWIHVVAALATAYSMEATLELIDARLAGRPYLWSGGGVQRVIDFFLPSHITGLAVAMLLYAGERVFPVMFGVAVALGSKALFRVQIGKGTRHVLNPSNTGIAAGLLLLPSMGASPPYQFTEATTGWVDWLIPAIIICTGTMLNARYTKKLPLIGGWLGGYLLQSIVRTVFFGAMPLAPLMPMTGVAFVLFTNYMVSDPATTPMLPWRQALFGASVALVYGALRVAHVYFAIFYALLIVCAVRGLLIVAMSYASRARLVVPAPAEVRPLASP